MYTITKVDSYVYAVGGATFERGAKTPGHDEARGGRAKILKRRHRRSREDPEAKASNGSSFDEGADHQCGPQPLSCTVAKYVKRRCKDEG